MSSLSNRRKEVMHGLTDEQREWVRAFLPMKPVLRNSASHGEHVDGWSVYRSPTTIHPPTTLRLHHRDERGGLISVISITENGVTRSTGEMIAEAA